MPLRCLPHRGKYDLASVCFNSAGPLATHFRLQYAIAASAWQTSTFVAEVFRKREEYCLDWVGSAM